VPLQTPFLSQTLYLPQPTVTTVPAMMLDPLLIAELLALGAFSGFLAGLLGIGGSMLMVPVMTWVMAKQGVPPDFVVHAAIGTSLATICVSSLSSVRAHHKRGAVRWPIVLALAPGILLGAYLGSAIATHLNSNVLGMVFGFFLFFSAAQMLANFKPKAARQLPPTPGMLAAGGVIGTLSGVLGAGGGFVSVPFMTWCNVPIHNAVATSAALGFPIALAGTVGYIVNGWHTPGMPAGAIGFVYLPALLVIVLASASTAPLGAKAAHNMDIASLKRAFACLLLLLGTYMLYRVVAS
jgi:uncharacterized protein